MEEIFKDIIQEITNDRAWDKSQALYFFAKNTSYIMQTSKLKFIF